MKKRYIIDLSQAQSATDIVFELSNIIENQDAANQQIWLKLGDIALNQSQLLSINSLINSINSELSLIESLSEQTELAATTLGINTNVVEEELEKELTENIPEAPLNTDDEKITEQYIPMVEHEEDFIENTTSVAVETNEDIEIEETQEVEEPKEELSFETEVIEKNNQTTDEYKTVLDEQISQETNEEIQDGLDSIFDAETKLENILSDDKDLNQMQNWPLTKESDDEDFEIPEEEMTDEDYEILKMPTKYHKQTVRSGQVITSDGNVVVIGDCHPGCEIQAAGDITVWGIMGGIAHAGCNGNTKAKIRALTLNAIQLRIADSYARRPDHIKNIYVEKSNTFTPEEARNINGSIVILKINDK